MDPMLSLLGGHTPYFCSFICSCSSYQTMFAPRYLYLASRTTEHCLKKRIRSTFLGDHIYKKSTHRSNQPSKTANNLLICAGIISVGTGAQVSIIPASYIDRRSGATTDPLQWFLDSDILVDLKGQRLIEGSTFSPTICSVCIVADYHIALLDSTSNKFRKIIGECPDLLQPIIYSCPWCTPPHHHFWTPTHARARRSSP